MTTETLMSPQELADMLGLPLATVYGFNYRGTGPRRISLGRHVRYRVSDVEAWLERQSDDCQPAACPRK